MEAGRTYRLEIAAGWPAVTGETLAEPVSRVWSVGPDDRWAVAPSSWAIEPPRAGTQDPLTIDFGEPLDHALAQRLITVLRKGEVIPGAIALTAADTRWSFHPNTPWRPADHILHVEAALEDLAGNNLRGAFDRGEDQAEGAAAAAEIPFRPRR